MKTVITINTIKYTIDLSKPLDISMSIRGSKDNANAWYIEEPKIEPAQIGEWTASVKEVRLLTLIIFNLIRMHMVRIPSVLDILPKNFIALINA